MERNLSDEIRERARAQRERREAQCRKKFGVAEPPSDAACRECRLPAAVHLLPNFDCPGSRGSVRDQPLGRRS